MKNFIFLFFLVNSLLGFGQESVPDSTNNHLLELDFSLGIPSIGLTKYYQHGVKTGYGLNLYRFQYKSSDIGPYAYFGFYNKKSEFLLGVKTIMVGKFKFLPSPFFTFFYGTKTKIGFISSFSIIRDSKSAFYFIPVVSIDIPIKKALK